MTMYSENWDCSCGYPAQTERELSSHIDYMTLVVGESFEEHH